MPRPTFAISVTFDIDPSKGEEFRKRVLQQASDSLHSEDFCHQFDVLVDSENPARFVLYETYDDAAAFDAHQQTSYFADFFATVSPWIVNKDLKKLEILPPLS